MISIYALINPITQHVFYIGVSKSPKSRLYGHLRDGKNNKICNYCNLNDLFIGRFTDKAILEKLDREKKENPTQAF